MSKTKAQTGSGKRRNRKYGASRRLLVNLWGRAKDPFNFRNYAPGQHGKIRSAMSAFAKQLFEKQKLRKYYNIVEKQFRNTFHRAAKKKGDTGQNFVGLLESRLDAFVFRANFVPTIFAARQLVNHKHVMVNGKVVNISSYQLTQGDVVQIREKSKDMVLIIEALQKQERGVPDYIEQDIKAMSAKYVRVPKFEDIPYPFVLDLNLIIEYYSR